MRWARDHWSPLHLVEDASDRPDLVDLSSAPGLAHLLGLAASELGRQRCRHVSNGHPWEACWRHPAVGLLCAACAVTHRQDLELHPWPDELDDETCDVCGPLGPRLASGDPDADLLALLESWPPRVRAHRISYRVGDVPVTWSLVLCDACLGLA
jgi:hypothetical protein